MLPSICGLWSLCRADLLWAHSCIKWKIGRKSTGYDLCNRKFCDRHSVLGNWRSIPIRWSRIDELRSPRRNGPISHWNGRPECMVDRSRSKGASRLPTNCARAIWPIENKQRDADRNCNVAEVHGAISDDAGISQYSNRRLGDDRSDHRLCDISSNHPNSFDRDPHS